MVGPGSYTTLRATLKAVGAFREFSSVFIICSLQHPQFIKPKQCENLATLLCSRRETRSGALVSKMNIHLQFKFDARNSWRQGLGTSELKTRASFFPILFSNHVYT